MSGRAYGLALVCAVVVGIGLTALLAEAQGRWDVANTDRWAADSARTRLASVLADLQQTRHALTASEATVRQLQTANAALLTAHEDERRCVDTLREIRATVSAWTP